jgi:hypothetical protein
MITKDDIIITESDMDGNLLMAATCMEIPNKEFSYLYFYSDEQGISEFPTWSVNAFNDYKAKE